MYNIVKISDVQKKYSGNKWGERGGGGGWGRKKSGGNAPLTLPLKLTFLVYFFSWVVKHRFEILF